MAILTVQTLDRSGLDLTAALAAAAAGGDEFANSDLQILFAILNGSGSPMTVTFVTQKTVDETQDLAVADLDVVIAAGAQVLVGPFPPAIYNDVDKRVQVTYSLETSVTVAAVILAKS